MSPTSVKEVGAPRNDVCFCGQDMAPLHFDRQKRVKVGDQREEEENMNTLLAGDRPRRDGKS